MNKTVLQIFIFFVYTLIAHRLIASDDPKKNVIPKVYTASRLTSEIKIDGIPFEDAWDSASVADKFIQLEPIEGDAITQATEVRVLYDNTAIYIAAFLHDTHPDSILHELGNRDETGNLNSDAFKFAIDPYNSRQSGYVFEISASGVQSESYNNDITFDAVWQSAVHIDEDGWTVEMKIPYSAIRFPAVAEQHWAVQFARYIRRNREYDQWTLTPKNSSNRMLFWGTMNGISNIDPPLRLSITPYLSAYTENAPASSGSGYENSYSYSGGVDIKYGIDERFTLDMTLLPDFSQIQSDNKVKNLSAYETIYEEKRPFFKEGTNLFSKGNIFYSRRIGRTPKFFYSVAYDLKEGEEIVENPDKARLLNATKISGRTNKGLGIGVLNAVTANTYAVIKEPGGTRRKVRTEAAANYNMLILDQELPNNSYVFLANSNVLRDGKERDANVTFVQGKFENKKHFFQLVTDYTSTRVFEWKTEVVGDYKKHLKKGEAIYVSADKINGSSIYGASYEVGTKNYDKNDMSFSFITDYSSTGVYYTYQKFNPFWKHFKQGSITLYGNRGGRLSSNNELTSANTGFNMFLLFNNNWSLYSETGFNPIHGRDFYEPRIDGEFYSTPPRKYGSVNFTTNYNKVVAFDFGGRCSYASENKNTNIGYYIIPMIRCSDHFNIKFSNYYDNYKNDIGFAYTSSGGDSSFFGQREIVTIENTLSTRYIFKNDMSLSLAARHYWSKGAYTNFFRLKNDGKLEAITVDDLHAFDFNSNYMTIDVVYNWQFAPGSSFLVTYKNSILTDSQITTRDYFSNLTGAFSDPQTNSISLKVLYYLDYQYLKRKPKSGIR